MDSLEVCKEILEAISIHIKAFCTCITLDEMIMHGHCISAELLFQLFDDWLTAIVITCNRSRSLPTLGFPKDVVAWWVHSGFIHPWWVLVQSCRTCRNRRTLSCRLAKNAKFHLNLRNKCNQTSRPGTHLGLKPPKAEQFQFGHG